MPSALRTDEVFRAPMRSRVDEVDAAAAVDWALAAGLVGVGMQGRPEEDDRLGARLRRFAEVADGSFVWTRDGNGMLYLGQMVGPLRRDPAGEPHDLENVRPCHWCRHPIDPAVVPAAVRRSFDRGGRNFQRISSADVFAATMLLWKELGSPAVRPGP